MTTLDKKLMAAIEAVLRVERPELQVEDMDGLVLRRSHEGPWYTITLRALWHTEAGNVILEGPPKVYARPGSGAPPADK